MKKWWMESIGYEIYLKSFFDSNNDGIGDLNGIRKKLDYLKNLGINLIWICPFYDSPMDDNGYDVRDFYLVDKTFGTNKDLKMLIDEAHALGIKVIFDFVLNHTSDEHQWFIESKSSKDNPYRDYYIWHDGRVIDGKKVEPTNWASFFGGSAWNYSSDTDSYYMKIFSNKMPDLNWKNKEVREEMKKIAKYYLDLGADGFRIDAVSHLDRASFVDSNMYQAKYVLDWFKFSNLPKVHDYLKELNQEIFSKYDAFTIGEVGGQAPIEEAKKYASFASNELSMVFNFDHNWCNNLNEISDYKDLKVRVKDLKNVFNKWQEAFKEIGFLPLNWLNHDQPRLKSHYGSVFYPLESTKMLSTALYLMRGTPFIYQGEEIGMTNYPFTDVSEFRDISTLTHYYEEVKNNPNVDKNKLLKKVSKTSRDNPRTPMQWNNQEYAGFSKVTPWINVNPNYIDINVEKQINDDNSLLNHYKKLNDLRLKSIYKDLIIYGSYEILDIENELIYDYKRENDEFILYVINSFSDKIEKYEFKMRIDEVIIHNYHDLLIENETITLRPFESIGIIVKKEK